MQKHRVTFALVILVLMSGTFQKEAVCKEADCTESLTDASVLQTAQSEWREFSSRAGGFSVLMPGTPKEEIEVKQFPVVGKAETHLFGLATESGVFVAGYVDIPGLAQQNQTFCDSFGKGFLGSVGDATAKGAGGKVLKETDILFGNDPGKEIIIEVAVGLATARAYFIKRRGYQLIAVPAASGEAGNVKKFLDSFKVIAR